MKNRVMFFSVAGDEMIRLEEFMQAHVSCKEDIFGGHFDFKFYPRPYGVLKTVSCICGERLYLDPPRH